MEEEIVCSSANDLHVDEDDDGFGRIHLEKAGQTLIIVFNAMPIILIMNHLPSQWYCPLTDDSDGFWIQEVVHYVSQCNCAL